MRLNPSKRLWTDSEWAMIKGSDLAAGLSAAGYTVLGVTNGKPQLQEEINGIELQELVSRLLRGEASPTPSPISADEGEIALDIPDFLKGKTGKKKSKQ